MAHETTHTLVIGAGPAGLAIGACLTQAGVPFLVLEQSDQLGTTWRRHYDRLHLHTDKAHSRLPFLAYPKDVPKYPSRQQLIQYLETYAAHFGLAPRYNQRVVSIARTEGSWETQTEDTTYHSEHVVVATGYAHVPVVPTWPGQATFSGRIMHSSQYKNGAAFRGQRVLVVGFGNSGGEIAIDLQEHGASPSLSVRSPVNVIPRELFGIPILGLAILATKLPAPLADALTAPILRWMYGDLEERGLRKLPYGPLTQIKRDAQIPLIDIGTMRLIKDGHLTILPGIAHFTDGAVGFVDGPQAPFDAVVLATGYRPGVQAFLKDEAGVLDVEGTPHQSGAEVAPGLFFCGFYVSPTGMLREIAKEARHITGMIAARYQQERGN